MDLESRGIILSICVAKTKALISFAVTAKLICPFVFRICEMLVPHDAAQIFCKSSSISTLISNNSIPKLMKANTSHEEVYNSDFLHAAINSPSRTIFHDSMNMKSSSHNIHLVNTKPLLKQLVKTWAQLFKINDSLKFQT